MFADWAHKYFEMGYMPIPVVSNKKIPAISGHTSVVITEEQVDKWCKTHGDCGIAILCGEKSGVIAIDVDKEESKKLCPPSPVCRVGKSEGFARFFKYDGTPSKRNGKLEIDIISDGKYIIIPPSIHENTLKPYYWTGPALCDVHVDDLPTIDQSFWDTFNKDTGVYDGIEIKGRNDYLFKAMCAKVGDGKDAKTCIAEILEEDQRLHDEPWFYTDEGIKPHNRGVPAAASMYVRALEHELKGWDGTKPVGFYVNLNTKPQRKYQKLPKLPGMGAVIFKDLYDNSPIPRSQFAFMATMQLFSIVVGCKMSYKGTFANLYQYGLAPSGYGKNFPVSRIKDYLIECGIAHHIGGESPTSETVVLKQLDLNRVKLWFVDEAESLLKRIKSDKQNHGLRERLTMLFDSPGKRVSPKLTLKANPRKDEDKLEKSGDVFSPYPNMLLTSTIKAFEKHGGTDIFNTGWGMRYLYYFEDRYKDEKYLTDYNPDIPRKIVQGLTMMYNLGRPNKNVSALVDFKIDKPSMSEEFDWVNIIPTDELLEKDKEIHTRVEKEKKKLYSGDPTQIDEIIIRKKYQINKFAILHHVMKNPADYLNRDMQPESLEWAYEAITAVMNNMSIHLDDTVSDTPLGKLKNDFLNYIKGRTRKKKGTNMGNLVNRFRGISGSEKLNILKELKNDQSIEQREGGDWYAR